MTETGIVSYEDFAFRQPPCSLVERLADDADSLDGAKILLHARGALFVRSQKEAHASPACYVPSCQGGKAVVRPALRLVPLPGHRSGVNAERPGDAVPAPGVRNPVLEIVASRRQPDGAREPQVFGEAMSSAQRDANAGSGPCNQTRATTVLVHVKLLRACSARQRGVLPACRREREDADVVSPWSQFRERPESVGRGRRSGSCVTFFTMPSARKYSLTGGCIVSASTDHESRRRPRRIGLHASASPSPGSKIASAVPRANRVYSPTVIGMTISCEPARSILFERRGWS